MATLNGIDQEEFLLKGTYNPYIPAMTGVLPKRYLIHKNNPELVYVNDVYELTEVYNVDIIDLLQEFDEFCNDHEGVTFTAGQEPNGTFVYLNGYRLATQAELDAIREYEVRATEIRNKQNEAQIERAKKILADAGLWKE